LLVSGAVLFAAGFMPWTRTPWREYVEAMVGRSLEQIQSDTRELNEMADEARRKLDAWAEHVDSSPLRTAPADSSWFDAYVVAPDGSGIRFTAWNSELTPLRIGLPNWLVPVIGLACALLALAMLKGSLDVPWRVPFALAGYAFVHAATYAALVGRGLQVGLGLAVVSSLAMVVLSWRLGSEQSVASPSEPA
jgi:hypothetical protein